MNKNFLIEYLGTDSPSTYEIEAQQLLIKEIGYLVDEVITDNYGNVAFKIKGTSEIPYKVVIDAHCDEISWVVKRITDEGLLYVARNGGTDNVITPAQPVKVFTSNKTDNKHTKVNGFFGWIPIHLKGDKPEQPNNDNLYVDIGASSKEAVINMGIDVGNFIVMDREPKFLNEDMVVGKSLDDKIGVFILSEVIKNLKLNDIKLPYDLYIVSSVQEEVGLYGSKMITETIKPDVAICFDVTFDTTTPGIDKNKHGNFRLGEGLVFRRGKDVNHKLFHLMKEVATKNDIPFKVSIDGAGGTNTFGYYLSNGGVVTGTVSIPLRYMHTPNEMVHLDDVDKTIKFLIKMVSNIENKHNFKLLG
jgi:putative aminopeptidase FrvX